MFHHHGRLDHLLHPRDYSSAAFFEREQATVFDRSWHYVCLIDELASPGDYVATDLPSVPVVCWNVDGTIKAFRNTCLHRHTRIIGPGRGHGDRLRCQYHAWEYGGGGHVAKIPDGRSFKGIRTKEWCLTSYRVAMLGSLVFVNLDPAADDLRESIGELAEEIDYFYGDHQPINRWVAEYPVNWKIAVENAVESYHVPMLHPSTFRDFKEEEHHNHVMHPAYTSYLDAAPMGNSLVDRGFKLFNRMTTRKIHFERAKHVNIFPNFMFYYREVYSVFSTVEPLGPNRTRFTCVGLLPRRTTVPVVGRAAQAILGRYLARTVRKILEEDVGIWTESHQGMRSSESRGVLSCREERVYKFQRFVAKRVGTAAAFSERYEEPVRGERD